MEQDEKMQNPEFIPPPPVSDMSDVTPIDTFKQDLLQTSMGGLDQIHDGMLTNQQQQEHNSDQMMMIQQQQLDHDMMIHHQQSQEQMMMHLPQQDVIMMQQQTMMESISFNPTPLENPPPPAVTHIQDIHDDLAISDSDDEDGGKANAPPIATETQENEEENTGLWF